MPIVQISGYQCNRCEYTWVPRLQRKPTICPRCKSPYWDRPIERESTSEALKKGATKK